MSDPFVTHGLWPTRRLCSWHFSGKNTEVGCHFLLQGIFLTQELNPSLLHLLPVQGTWVWYLIQEYSTCCGATKLVHNSHWASALEPASRNHWAPTLKPLRSACPMAPEPLLPSLCHNYWSFSTKKRSILVVHKRNHCSEKLEHCNKEQLPPAATRESPHTAVKTQHSQK